MRGPILSLQLQSYCTGSGCEFGDPEPLFSSLFVSKCIPCV